jgi:hypothetical protein
MYRTGADNHQQSIIFIVKNTMNGLAGLSDCQPPPLTHTYILHQLFRRYQFCDLLDAKIVGCCRHALFHFVVIA